MMNHQPESRQPGLEAGLCAGCRHALVVSSDRGSQFLLCGRSKADPAFPKYPRLPVLACNGCEPKAIR